MILDALHCFADVIFLESRFELSDSTSQRFVDRHGTQCHVFEVFRKVCRFGFMMRLGEEQSVSLETSLYIEWASPLKAPLVNWGVA